MRFIDNGAGAGRVFLSRNPNAAAAHAFDGGIDVGVTIDYDRVLPAHFKDGAFDPLLSGTLRPQRAC